MSAFRIDLEASTRYKDKLAKLRKSYRRIDQDLANAYQAITQNYKQAAHANAIPGFQGEVWKYRCKSSDMGHGSSGGFRILARYFSDSATLVPFFIYTHQEYENAPPIKEVTAWLQDLIRHEPPSENG